MQESSFQIFLKDDFSTIINSFLTDADQELPKKTSLKVFINALGIAISNPKQSCF